jgi:hypothetical protein
MEGEYTLEELLDFLAHAAERGLVPAATAQALSVATRNVFGVLDDAERASLGLDDLDGVIRRFQNKRARDFNPTSLKEYGRRVRRAAEMFLQWKADPANFKAPTRATSTSNKRSKNGVRAVESARSTTAAAAIAEPADTPTAAVATPSTAVYETRLPVRPGHMVQLSNLPFDLSVAEAERLAQFVRLLGAE